MKRGVLVYPSTIVGYVRLILLGCALAWHFLGLELIAEAGLRPGFVVLIGLSRLLDLLDGHLARKFNQTTPFGTLFDLLLDLTSHTIVWTLSGFYFGPALIGLEWAGGLYMAAFSMRPGTTWKTTLTESGPGLMKAYFGNHQRNLLSAYGNISHFTVPMAFYVGVCQAWVYYLALPGLILYEVVTLYVLYVLMKLLIQGGPGV